MTDLSIDDPCVLFALNRERSAFHRDFPPTQRFPGAPCWARFCGPPWLSVLVTQTGVGAAETARAVEWALSGPTFDQLPYRPKLMLFAGFAGALNAELKVGDLVLATEVVDLEGNRWPTTWPGELPEERWQPPLRRGRLLSAAAIVGDPAEKSRLATQHDALAVDMESAVFARLCTKAGVPFGCLRAVSDDARTPLSPELVNLLKQGSVSWWRATLALLRRPRLLGEMLRLARTTRLASQQLGLGLGELLTLTLPWDLREQKEDAPSTPE